jgi:hypothetical protein
MKQNVVKWKRLRLSTFRSSEKAASVSQTLAFEVLSKGKHESERRRLTPRRMRRIFLVASYSMASLGVRWLR